MPRYFTLAAAQALIPRVRGLLEESIRLRAEYADAERAVRKTAERITMMGGVRVDRDAAQSNSSRLTASVSALNLAIREVEQFGCQVKDLDVGLIDFPTLYRGEEACICWKLGEAKIAHWHRADEGFSGRKPIDQDFLQNHGAE